MPRTCKAKGFQAVDAPAPINPSFRACIITTKFIVMLSACLPRHSGRESFRWRFIYEMHSIVDVQGTGIPCHRSANANASAGRRLERTAFHRKFRMRGITVVKRGKCGRAMVRPPPHEHALTPINPNAAECLGIERYSGTIEENKWADLVMLTQNPLADVANTQKISAVFLRGKHYTKEDLETLLHQVEKENAGTKSLD